MIDPVSWRCFISAAMSRPLALYTAPSHSMMQMILYPARAISLAAMPPTFPNP